MTYTKSPVLTVSFIGLAQILSWGSSYYLPAVLASGISRDTGWHQGWVIGSLSIAFLVSGLISPRIGRLIDINGGRPVLATGAALMALGQAVMGYAPALPVFLAGWVITGAGMGCCLYSPAFSTLGRLYGEKARGYITLLTLFGGFASTVCWPVSAYLVTVIGWRGVCFTYSLAHILVVLPVYLLVLPAEKRKVLPSGKKSASEHAMIGSSEKKAFMLFASGQTLASLVMTVLSVHILVLLQSRGIALPAAVALGTLLGPSQVGARVAEALFGRNLHPVWSLVIAVSAFTAGLGIMTGLPAVVAFGIILYGAGNGLRSITSGTVPLALFGSENYSVLMGRLSMPNMVAQAASPVFGTFLIRQTGPQMTMNILLFLAVASVFITLFLVPYAGKRRKSDL